MAAQGGVVVVVISGHQGAERERERDEGERGYLRERYGRSSEL